MQDFTTLYAERSGQIARLARTHVVPGLTIPEIETEMMHALWKAHRTFDPERGASFDTHWFRVWATWKLNLIESHFAMKRKMLLATDPERLGELSDDMARTYGITDVYAIPPCPNDDPLVTQVWRLIATGLTFSEVQETLHIGRKKFDAIMRFLRTDPSVQVALGH